jgi:hypothetical protein
MRSTFFFGVGVVLAGSIANSGRAQIPIKPNSDSSIYSVLARISEESMRSVRITTSATGRLDGRKLQLRGDSALLVGERETRAIGVAQIDSVWTQRSSLAAVVGLIAAVPCAVLGAAAGAFFGGDRDSGGSPARQKSGAVVGAVAGGLFCGAVGAGIGSTIRPWRLEYARP